MRLWLFWYLPVAYGHFGGLASGTSHRILGEVMVRVCVGAGSKQVSLCERGQLAAGKQDPCLGSRLVLYSLTVDPGPLCHLGPAEGI